MTTKIYVSAGYDELMRHFGDGKLADVCYRETLQATIDDEGDAHINTRGKKCWLHSSLFVVADERSHGEFDLVLVACCGEKLEGSHRAEDLYQSQLFKASAAWAKANGKEWAILSAKHGLVWPDEVIESYDVVLSTPKSRSPHLKPIYYKNVIRKIRDYKNRVSCPKIAVLAGKHYLEPFQYEPNTSFPLAGKGIGQRLQFLKKAAVAVTACVGQLELF
tara:strand:+ start:855 stop:1511 length:657 start_codon:yes stop_codon:yes gene_type:complete